MLDLKNFAGRSLPDNRTSVGPQPSNTDFWMAAALMHDNLPAKQTEQKPEPETK